MTTGERNFQDTRLLIVIIYKKLQAVYS